MPGTPFSIAFVVLNKFSARLPRLLRFGFTGIHRMIANHSETHFALNRPSPFLECRFDAPPADPRKGPIGHTLGTVGDILAPGIASDRID